MTISLMEQQAAKWASLPEKGGPRRDKVDFDLGLFIDQIKLDYGAGLIVPPLIVYALLIAGVIGVYGLSRTIGLSKRISFVIAVILLIMEAIGVIGFRLWIAHNSPWIAATTIGAWLIALRLKKSKMQDAGSKTIPHSESPQGHFAVRTPTSAITFILAVVLMWRIMPGADSQPWQ